MSALAPLEALLKIAQGIARNGGRATDEAAELGANYRAAAQAVPDYFKSGAAPAKDWSEAAQRFGVSRGQMPGIPGFLATSGAHDAHIIPLRTTDSIGSQAPSAAMNQLLDELFNTGRKPYMIEASALPSGAGAAKSIYPAVLDVMGSQGRTNVADALTMRNKPRRSFQMADSNLKFGDNSASNIGPKQLSMLHTSPLDFMRSSGDEQLGLLLTDAGLQAQSLVRPVAHVLDSTAEGLGVTPASSLAQWQDYGKALHTFLGGSPAAVGDSTLRRLHALDALSQGREVEPSLLQQLNYAAGGVVRG